MKLKFQKFLSDKQVLRAKFELAVASILVTFLISKDFLVAAEKEILNFNDETWTSSDTAEFDRGRIVYFSNSEMVCTR